MKVITVRSQIRELADKIKAQWQNPNGTWTRPDREKIHAAVAALDPETATIDDVRAAMGFVGWIDVPRCNECDQLVDRVVQLGEEPDYESRTAYVCIECLQKALKEATT